MSNPYAPKNPSPTRRVTRGRPDRALVRRAAGLGYGRERQVALLRAWRATDAATRAWAEALTDDELRAWVDSLPAIATTREASPSPVIGLWPTHGAPELPDHVRHGSVRTVQLWVAADPAKAKVALEHEQANGRRVTLLTWLESRASR